jgi:Universal stress protein family
MHLGMPKRILVPTDFSETSRTALKEAAAVAEGCAAELVVLYADPLIPPLDAEVEQSAAGKEVGLLGELEIVLGQVTSAVGDGRRVDGSPSSR